LRQGDGLAAAQGRYDLILCNPPYVNQNSMKQLPAEYRAEPAMALAGGPDGMDFVRRLIEGAAGHLQPQGALVLEIGHERPHFEAAFPTLQPLWLSTSAGDDQVLLLTREQLT
jgi:ribosomal protein L3 glutamine methyltransferase